MTTKRLPQLVCLVLAVLVFVGSSSGDAATPDAVAAVVEAVRGVQARVGVRRVSRLPVVK